MDEAQQQQHDNHREGERTPDRSGHRKEQSCDLANQGSDHQDSQALVPTGQEGEGAFGGASNNLGVYLTGQGDAFFVSCMRRPLIERQIVHGGRHHIPVQRVGALLHQAQDFELLEDSDHQIADILDQSFFVLGAHLVYCWQM